MSVGDTIVNACDTRASVQISTNRLKIKTRQ